MVTVIARYHALPGSGDEIARALSEHVAATRAEPGCLQFIAYRESEDRESFLLYEQYVDEAAFEAHRSTPHFRDYVEGTIVPQLAQRQWAHYDEIEPRALH